MPKLSASTLVVALCLAAVPAAAEDIVITQYKADPSGAPYGIAIEKGFFKQAGIDITGVISGAGGGTSVRSAIASSLGFGDVSPAPVIAAIEQGQDIKIVTQGSRSLADNVVIVMPNSPIKSVKDLKGKKFAISNPKSLGEMTAVLVFEQAGLKPDDVQRVALGGLSGALTALENGVVDATSIPGILFLMRGGESKYRVLLGPSELPLLPPAIGMATGDLIKKHPEKLRALLAGRRARREIHLRAHAGSHPDPEQGLRAVAAEGRRDAGQPAGGGEILERRADRDDGFAECGTRDEIRRVAGEGGRPQQDDRRLVRCRPICRP